MWKILKEMGIQESFSCLLRDLYAGQEQQLELDMRQQTGSKLGKGVCQCCILSAGDGEGQGGLARYSP